jgi:nitrite reductase/ring-hydroxylating ferredoxin subunit
VALSTTGLALVSGSAWLGGELVYPLGTGVSRNAFEPEVEKYTAVARLDDVPEGILWKSEVDVDGQKIPLVLLRRGDRVMALSSVCSHWGGPLAEGKLLEGDVVQCPWHKSQFNMSDGTVCGGPASMSQPSFETRVEDGWIRVRRKD